MPTRSPSPSRSSIRLPAPAVMRHLVRHARLLGPLSSTAAMLGCTCGLTLSVRRGEPLRDTVADHRRRVLLLYRRPAARPPATVSSES